MSSEEFNLDTFLSDKPVDIDGFVGSSPDGTGGASGEAWKEPGYEGKIDYRIRQLSYSSLLTLHTCPRKFELYKKRTTHRSEESEKSNITFAFGHIVGEGIQEILAGSSLEQCVFKMFLGWHADLFAVDEKMNKSFWSAVIAIQRFISLREAGLLTDYEVVIHNGKPACELSFAVTFPDGFRLRGFVDVVLRHKFTGEVLVLEIKTTGSATLNPATYKNSAQAIGYSIVLDVIFPDLSSYKVLYLVYQTKSGEYTPIPFTKTWLQRALWIRELLLDIETIKMYEDAEVYPMHGESCYSFFRECEYINSCTLSNAHLVGVAKEEDEDKIDYQINLSLKDLLDAQFNKVTIES